jgi:hypothetical protein
MKQRIWDKELIYPLPTPRWDSACRNTRLRHSAQESCSHSIQWTTVSRFRPGKCNSLTLSQHRQKNKFHISKRIKSETKRVWKGGESLAKLLLFLDRFCTSRTVRLLLTLHPTNTLQENSQGDILSRKKENKNVLYLSFLILTRCLQAPIISARMKYCLKNLNISKT